MASGNASFVSADLVVVAEWLRRWTRNPLGSPRVGSIPTDYYNGFTFHEVSLLKPGLRQGRGSQSMFCNVLMSRWFASLRSVQAGLDLGFFTTSQFSLR